MEVANKGQKEAKESKRPETDLPTASAVPMLSVRGKVTPSPLFELAEMS
jgi:hypothetical protein